MAESPLYIFMDENLVQVHKEVTYHQASDGRFYVELSDPILTVNRDDTEPRSRESYARLCEWLATAREEST